MHVVEPIDISLISSNVAEDLYSEWDAAATYATGDRVYVTLESDGTTERTPHEIYESLVDSNTGNYPPDDAAAWRLIGTSNRWAMFDPYVNTQTENHDEIVVTLRSGQCDWLGLFNLEATAVALSLYDNTSGQTVYTYSYDLQTSDVIDDWWKYFFAEIEYEEAVALWFPFYYDSQVTITIKNPGLTARCGVCTVGRAYEIGSSQWGWETGIDDYSKKDTDQWGNTYLKQGFFAKRASGDVQVETKRLPFVQRKLASLRATPCLWDANNVMRSSGPCVNAGAKFSNLVVFGFYKEFKVLFKDSVHSTCTLTIEGLR